VGQGVTEGCLGCNRLENDDECRTLIDGRVVCSHCPDWRDECQARAILQMPKERRRAFLFGDFEHDDRGVKRLKTKGLQQIHGEASAKRVADLVRRVWEHGRAGRD
jgi:hypothetical protein